MKKETLHEIAKVLVGVVFGKILFLWGAYAAGILPLSFWGITWDVNGIFPAIAFNVALCLILIHYGWNVGKIPTLREKNYFAITGAIFTLVALLYIFRIFAGGLDFILFGWAIPVLFSWVGVVIAGFLAYMSFRLRNHYH